MAGWPAHDRIHEGMTDFTERMYQIEVDQGKRKDDKLAVVCYLWNETGFSDPRGFEPEQVNFLARQVKDHFALPYRFICITDETDGFADGVVVVGDFEWTEAKINKRNWVERVVATTLFAAQGLDVWQCLGWTSHRKELQTSLPAVQPGVTAAAIDPKLADSPTTCDSQSCLGI